MIHVLNKSEKIILQLYHLKNIACFLSQNELQHVPRMSRIHTCPLWFALAVISVHPIYTGSSIKASMVWTIINVLLTVLTTETYKGRCCLFPQHV